MKKSLKILGVVAVTILIIVAIAPVLAKPIFIQIKFCDSPANYRKFGVPHELLESQYQHGEDLEYRDFAQYSPYSSWCPRPNRFNEGDIVATEIDGEVIIGKVIGIQNDEYILLTRDGEIMVNHSSIVGRD